jgi:hypothetical protein
VSGYWRASGPGEQPRKAERDGGEAATEGRRERRSRADDHTPEASGDPSRDTSRDPIRDAKPFAELTVEEQADHLRGPRLPEDLCLDVAREWMERIDRELQHTELAQLPAFGPVLQGLAPPLIAYDTIYRPGMDPDDPDGRETADKWTELGYSLQVKGYRPLYAENIAYLLKVQLASAKIESKEDTPAGVVYQLRTGLIGENGRHAILVSRWLVRPGTQRPELLRAWPEPLPALPSGDDQ